MGLYIAQFKHISQDGEEVSNDFKIEAAGITDITDAFAPGVLSAMKAAMITYTTGFKWRVSPIPSNRTSYIEGEASGSGGFTADPAVWPPLAMVAQTILVTDRGLNGAKYWRDVLTQVDVIWGGEEGEIIDTFTGHTRVSILSNAVYDLATEASITLVVGTSNRSVSGTGVGIATIRNPDKRWHNRRLLVP